MSKKEPKTLSTKEYSIITGLPVAAVTKMLRSGQLSGTKRSGRWMISQDQATTKSVTSPKTTTRESKASPSIAAKAVFKSDYSIGEFCKITYLTEFGIERWLKKGKIKGRQDDDGNWRIDADSLNLPNIKHLLRE